MFSRNDIILIIIKRERKINTSEIYSFLYFFLLPFYRLFLLFSIYDFVWQKLPCKHLLSIGMKR